MIQYFSSCVMLSKNIKMCLFYLDSRPFVNAIKCVYILACISTTLVFLIFIQHQQPDIRSPCNHIRRFLILNTTNRSHAIPRKLHFIYYHQPMRICTREKHPDKLLILVKSNVINIVQRMAIRYTWGNITISGVRLLFVLGKNKLVDEQIALEARNHDDILQGDFIDSYFNNTYKTVMTFEWVVQNCNTTPVLFFVDDDFLVNVENIVEYTNSKLLNSVPYIYRGYLIPNAKPDRNPTSKWFTSFSEFSGDFFPPYLGGGSVLMTMNVAEIFTKTFEEVKYIFVDDAYLGLVAAKCNVVPSNEHRIWICYKPLPLEQIPYYFSLHGFNDTRLLIDTWSALNKNKIRNI